MGNGYGIIPTVEEDKARMVISEQLGCPEKDVTLDRHLAKDLGADSLDLTELIISLEEEFKIDISNKEGEKLETVKDVIDLIENKVKEK